MPGILPSDPVVCPECGEGRYDGWLDVAFRRGGSRPVLRLPCGHVLVYDAAVVKSAAKKNAFEFSVGNFRLAA